MSPQTYCFDAAEILGIGTPTQDPLPAPEAGVITIRVPEGLSLRALRDSVIGMKQMWQHNWYDAYPWSTEAPPAGIYRLRVPVLNTNGKTADQQVAMLPTDETLAPVALVVAALLCIHLRCGAGPLQHGWTRCAEQTADGCRVELTWFEGRLYVCNYWNDDRSSYLWSSSVRTSS